MITSTPLRSVFVCQRAVTPFGFLMIGTPVDWDQEPEYATWFVRESDALSFMQLFNARSEHDPRLQFTRVVEYKTAEPAAEGVTAWVLYSGDGYLAGDGTQSKFLMTQEQDHAIWFDRQEDAEAAAYWLLDQDDIAFQIISIFVELEP